MGELSDRLNALVDAVKLLFQQSSSARPPQKISTTATTEFEKELKDKYNELVQQLSERRSAFGGLPLNLQIDEGWVDDRDEIDELDGRVAKAEKAAKEAERQAKSSSVLLPAAPSISPPLADDPTIDRVEDYWFAKAAVPANRSDDCAWIRSSPPCVYATLCRDPEGSDVDDGKTVSSGNASDFIKILFPASGDGCRREPNVRTNDIIPVLTSGGQPDTAHSGDYRFFCFSGAFYDEPVGSVRFVFEPDFSLDPPDGWYWMDDTNSHDMPNTAVTTSGTTVANTDVRQTLVTIAEYIAHCDGPFWNNQGSVASIGKFMTSSIASSVAGSFFKAMQRFN